ncbi:MAG: division/cell wall cluster transcriptional repressor MraZ [Candidatus Kapabacteria bacterium]|nr:division/cell wall cluster transcriptional repressor MraZ [Candidatus Kapabacteria bacterium]MDW7997081.1 division/cell wall cluster transcriptional repressor MraZ [Bacteroidota bacterium]MDW8225363.1 division/cell wall cluster transcriptional repressor MraZ [Bacteroidota bacterium]
MAFFKGHETHSLDNKGRVSLPVKMRRNLSPEAQDTFIVTRGVDRCIVAYPLDEWRKYEERFARLNQYDTQERFFLRMILAWSEEVQLDAQQRLMLPRRHIEFAGIQTKVTIVGMGDHLEFWNPEEFDRYLAAFAQSYEEVAAHVMRSP